MKMEGREIAFRPMADPLPPADLLEHAAFVRRLAVHLLRGDADADDVAQETLARAIEHPPEPRAGGIRPWLATVLRNLVRKNRRAAGRRGSRERIAARGEAVGAADDLAARTEILQLIADAVRALDATSREVVLLRHYQDLPPRAIAARLSIPVDTVRSRLRRAHERLRTRLDERRGGNVEGWRSALHAMVGASEDAKPIIPAPAAPIGGILAMGTAAKLGIGIALAAVIGSGAWLLATGGRDESSPRHAGTPADGDTVVLAEDAATRTPGLAGSTPRNSGAARPAAADLTTPPPVAEVDAGGIVVIGRVVDLRRRPVEGATVRIRLRDRAGRNVRSGPDGRFRVAVGARPDGWVSGFVQAEADGSRSGTAQLSLGPKNPMEQDVGTISVKPGVALRARVMDEGAPVASARVFARELVEMQKLPIWGVEATSDPDGMAALGTFHEAEIEILALTADSRRGVARVSWPPRATGAGAVEVELEPARTVVITVVDAQTGAPVADAHIEVQRDMTAERVMGDTPYDPRPDVKPTDAAGTTRIEGLGKGEVIALAVTAAGYPAPVEGEALGLTKPNSVPADTTDFRVALYRGRTIRCRVVPGEGPPPPDGATLQLVDAAGRGTFVAHSAAGARMDGSEIVIEGVADAPFAAGVVALDGSRTFAFAQKGQDRGGDVSFVRPRTVEVSLHDEAGKPVPGVGVFLGRGNGEAITDRLSTDADGGVVFKDQFGWKVNVHVLDGSSLMGLPGTGVIVGTVDLQKGDGRVDAILHTAREVRIRVTIDGKPGLPPQFKLNLGSHQTGIVQEDPDAGALRAAFRGPEGEVGFSLRATGYVEQRGTAREESPGGPLLARIDLVSTGTVLIRVIPPTDGVYEVTGVAPPGGGGGLADSLMAARAVPGQSNLWRIEGARAGSWSVRDVQTGIVAGPVDVPSGGASPEVRLDLSRVGVATGRIEVPSGFQATDLRLLTTGQGLNSGRPFADVPGTPVSRDGTWKVRVPGDRPVTLAGWHPILKPAPNGGTATITEPRDDIVLRMVEGPRATFRPDPPPVVPSIGHPSQQDLVRVTLFRDATAATGAPSSKAVFADGVVRFGGFETGTYAILLDAYGLAPLFLPKVALGDGATDLGTIAFSAGGSVRVRMQVKEGQATPQFDITARSKLGPDHYRWVHGTGEPELVLQGLGPVRYEVTVASNSRDKIYLTKMIDSDGVGETLLTIDLR